MKLLDKVALVTGAGRGIGRSIALTLAREGATVVLSSRTYPQLESVRKEIETAGGKAISIRSDITLPQDIVQLFEAISQRFHRLDILVNNAGIGYFVPVTDLRLEEFDAMWNLNIRGLFLCVQKALPMMQTGRGGTIVNISSLAGKNAFVNGAGYAATKWALMGFSNCLRLEVRQSNIRVITICPGSVDTEFANAAMKPGKTGSILQPQDVADTVLAAVTAPERAMVSEIDIRPTNPR